jgi:hypothetical protein
LNLAAYREIVAGGLPGIVHRSRAVNWHAERAHSA